MKTLIRLLLSVAVPLLIMTSAHAELVVIVAAKAGIAHLSREEVINIFLGRYRKLPTGMAAVPYDLGRNDQRRADFYQELLEKNVSEINAYWARLLLSGKTNPPASVGSQSEALEMVARTPGAIAYVDRTMVDDRVTVVLSLGQR